ncbi:MAG TPA: pilus assembly protein TadG-related protein [Candidatus Angelobacter sp.]|jgi:hypothetical protein|nr:pilus assembly protein TadG-related protein [Candidatus Angelobacter sp.]
MRAMIWQRLQRLHSDESGQVLWIFVVSGLALVVLAALVFNTGKQATRRMEMQNAVDASAVSGAMWFARGMNVISMDNVAMTETLGLIANLRAIQQSIPINRVILEAEDAIADALMSNPFTVAAGVALKIAVVLGTIETDIVDSVSGVIDALARPTTGILWEFMRTLSYFSEAVTYVAPAIGFGQAINVGRQNIRWLSSSAPDASMDTVSQSDVPEGALLLPNFKTGGYALPAEPGSFQELCDPTHHGTHSSSPVDTRGYQPFLGYPYGKGPFEKYKDWVSRMWLPSFISGIPGWYRGIADMNLAIFCQGSSMPSFPKIPVRTNDLAAARREGATEFVWTHSSVSTAPIDQDPGQPAPNEDAMDFEPVSSSSGDQFKQSAKQLAHSGLPVDELIRQGQNKAASKPAYNSPVDSNTYASETLNETADFQPPGKQIRNWVWTQRSTTSQSVEIEQPPPAKPISKTRYVITEDRYTFQYATVNKSFDQQLKQALQDKDASGYPQPFHFVVDGQKLSDPGQLPQAIQCLQYLAVAHVGDNDRPWLNGLKVSIRGRSRPVFENPSQWGMLTYAQVQVYNPTSWDLYTQDWHVKLVPATLLEQYLNGGALGGSSGFGGVGAIVKELNAH